ncbi:hypothetical protein ABW16_07230 [Mycolicibacter heraklionensis]|uniref:Uncharacterized protein n=1 Tax=Mycolicibacter heraklionensis TaxID=512402 RepID=A0ABR5FHW1_9MYCO|nr:hypothetical protein [Mycolicibacter heraklionensis]KLO30205.1 hypothetical protein ABW16_07230 [Mycolicibacter heraklionensis]
MLGPIAIMPSAPVLVPELAGAAAEAAELRAAALVAARSLPASWVAVGAGPDAVYGPDSAGSFAGFGADVAVRLSPGAQHPVDLPLCALVAGWVRGQVCPDAEVVVHCCADPGAALATGGRLRTEIDRGGELTGVLVLADGANTVSPAAPGGHHPADVERQRALDDALAGGDVAALTGLPPQVVGRAGFAALAGLVGTAPRGVTQLYRDAPYGVGYFVGVWQP